MNAENTLPWWDDPNVLSWDWNEQPDLDALGALLARHGVTVTEVGGASDQYAIRIETAVPGPTAAANPDALAWECGRLLDEVDRLRELKCAVCGMRVAHLNHAGHVIGWGCADGEHCEPGPASGMPRPPAEVAAPGSAADSRPETRTGVSATLSEAHLSDDVEAASDWIARHYDDIDGWTIHTRHGGGLLVVHDSDPDMPSLELDVSAPLGAVLAFIADQEGQADER